MNATFSSIPPEQLKASAKKAGRQAQLAPRGKNLLAELRNPQPTEKPFVECQHPYRIIDGVRYESHQVDRPKLKLMVESAAHNRKPETAELGRVKRKGAVTY